MDLFKAFHPTFLTILWGLWCTGPWSLHHGSWF